MWFDSGCTHVFTLESGAWPEQEWPADLYLEGSDQHRGWFQSSLLESCGTRGRAPYKAVLTHGFTMDAKGMKMSKSVGNTINPLDLMRDYGADILRLWALSVDFTEDHRIGKEILTGVADQYRKLRNTFRYLLGALDGFCEDERVAVEAMPELERYMLALLAQLDARMRTAVEDYDFNDYTRALGDFCNEDLSAFFFDIRKDSLYCDAADRPQAPRLSHRARHAVPRAGPLGRAGAGVHGRGSVGDALSRRRQRAFARMARGSGDCRPTTALEAPASPEHELGALRALRSRSPRRSSRCGATRRSGRASKPKSRCPTATITGPARRTVHRVESRRTAMRLAVTKTDNHKCGRCWRLLPEVAEDGDLCNRCEEVVHA